MKILRFIGFTWIIGPFIVIGLSNSPTQELYTFGFVSIFMGLLIIMIKPKKDLRTNDSFRSNATNVIEFQPREVVVSEPKNTSSNEIEPLVKIKPVPTVEVKKPEIIQTPKKGLELKKVNYSPSIIYEQKEPYDYPVVKMPKKETYIKFSKIGRSNKKGHTEDQFFIVMEKYFKPYFKVHNNRHIVSQNGVYKYEPDFLIESVDDNKNIFINIEIDEPYDGISRIPTHEIYKDNYRDLFFINRGYIVIRFTEKQVFEEANQCCEYIANVIKSIDADYVVDKKNINKSLSKQKQWDGLQAKKWALVNYRENYLGIKSFASREFHEFDFDIENSQIDDFIESKINDFDSSFSNLNDNLPLIGNDAHERDKRIHFESENHRYYIDGNPDTISVSELIDKFFPEFDAVKAAENLNSNHELYGLPIEEIISHWKNKGVEAAELGTELHQQIENYYKKIPNKSISKEFQYFLNFKERYSTMIPHRTEWRIFDEDYLIAGTIDMIYKKEDGSFYMFDWKRSEKVVERNGNPKLSDPSHKYSKFAYGGLNHLTDDSYNRYALQQNIYKYILEKKYGYKINSMNLLILHPNYDTYHWLKLPNMQKEVQYMLNELIINK